MGEKFISVEEFSAACPKAGQTHLASLREMGALGDMPESKQLNLFEM